MEFRAMKVKIIERQCLLDDFFKIESISLQFEKFSGGMSNPVHRLNLERGDSVGVLLKLTDSGRFVLLRQFRYAAYDRDKQGWLDEIIAGTFSTEPPEQCAIRETREESGFDVAQLVPMADFYASPGGTTERIFLYYATASSSARRNAGGGLKAENEDIQVNFFTETEIKQMISSNKIKDAKTLIALQQYFLNKDFYDQYK